MSSLFLTSQVGNGSAQHCLSGSARTNVTTSAGVTAENSRSSQPAGAGVKVGGAAAAKVEHGSGGVHAGHAGDFAESHQEPHPGPQRRVPGALGVLLPPAVHRAGQLVPAVQPDGHRWHARGGGLRLPTRLLRLPLPEKALGGHFAGSNRNGAHDARRQRHLPFAAPVHRLVVACHRAVRPAPARSAAGKCDRARRRCARSISGPTGRSIATTLRGSRSSAAQAS